MAEHTEYIYSSTQRWREGSVAACFSWPSFELVQDRLAVPNVGDIVYAKGKMPQWRYRIARGLNATTLLDAEESKFTYTPGHIYLGKWCGGSVQRFGFYQEDGDLFGGHSSVWGRPPAAPTIMDPKTRDEALQRAIQDARSKQNSFRGSNFVAELRDTIRGLRNPVKGFRRLLDTYHGNARRRVKQSVGKRSIPVSQEDFRRLERDAPDVARSAQRALSDSWLEANFGWSPLLGDAVDAYHALRKLSLTVPLERFFGRSSNDDPPTYVSFTRNLQITPLSWNVRTFVRYDVTFYGAVKVQTDTPTGRAVEEFGFRARDFLPAVWEAIPYSFLIDYFTNVGEIIETVSFPRSDIAWITRTFRNHSIRSTERVAISNSSPAYPTNGGNLVWSFSPPRVEWDRKYVNRVAYSDSIVPSLRFEIPGSKNWRKWCNIAALARLRTL
jgi:hypothetical protein